MNLATTETGLVKACLDVLAWSNVVADSWRNNTGAAPYDNGHGKRRVVQFGRKGVSDILGMLRGGRFLAVECKVGKNTLTAPQREFLETVNAAGGVGLVIRDTSELLAALTHLAEDPAWAPRQVG